MSTSLAYVQPFVGNTFNPGQPVPCMTAPHLFETRTPYRRTTITPKEAAAIALCRTCPVIDACRDWSLKHSKEIDQTGVMGGLTSGERRQAAGRPPPTEHRPASAPPRRKRCTHSNADRIIRGDGTTRCRACSHEYDARRREQRKRSEQS